MMDLTSDYLFVLILFWYHLFLFFTFFFFSRVVFYFDLGFFRFFEFDILGIISAGEKLRNRSADAPLLELE